MGRATLFLLCLTLYLILGMALGYWLAPLSKQVVFSAPIENDKPLLDSQHITFPSFAHLPILPREKPLPFYQKGVKNSFYAKKAPSLKEPRVSFVIIKMGLNRPLMQEIIKKVPTHFTLSFSIDAQELEKQMALARENGFETWLDLPIKDIEKADVGSYALSNGSETFYNMKMLENLWALPVPTVGWVANNFISDSLQAFFENTTYVLAAQKPCSSCLSGFSVEKDISITALTTLLEQVREKAIQSGQAILFIPPEKPILATVVRFVNQHKELNYVPLSNQNGGLQ